MTGKKYFSRWLDPRGKFLNLQKADMTGSWHPGLAVLALAVFLFVVFPAAHFGLHASRWPPQYGHRAFYLLTLAALLGSKLARPADLGLSTRYLTQHILLGGLLGGIVALTPPLLDGVIDLARLGDREELFAASVNRMRGKPVDPFHSAAGILIIPFLEQVFFSGFLVQTVLRKFKPMTAIFTGALLFGFMHATPGLGTLAIGLVTAGLYYRTGTVWAPWMFQGGCAVGWILLTHLYPRLVTLFIFLF